jgi:hypothetical protein
MLGMLALVVAAEAFVARHDDDFTTVWAHAWKRAGESARRDAPGCAVLGFGDSVVMHGVAPRVLEDRLGARAWNLAVFKGQGPTAYFLLRRALDAGARPSAVFMDGELLMDDPRVHMRLWSELAGLRDGLDLAWTARDADFFASLVVARLLPTARARYEIRANILGALRADPWFTRFASRSAVAIHRRNWQANRGAHIVPRTPGLDKSHQDAIAASNVGKAPLPPAWSCDPLNEVYVRRFLALAESRRIPVYWLLAPIHPDVQAWRDRWGYNVGYRAFLRGLQGRYPGLSVIDGHGARYATSALWDPTHLSRPGASIYSGDLAALLAARLAPGAGPAPRWIELPGYRERPIAPPLEDLEQSRTALREARAARRR